MQISFEVAYTLKINISIPPNHPVVNFHEFHEFDFLSQVLDTEPDMNEDAQTESSPPNIRANPGRDDDNDNDDDAVASITCPTAQSDLRHGPLEISHSSGQDAMPVRWISPQTYKNPILATSVQSGDMKQSTTNDAEQNQTEEQLTTCVL